MSFFQEELPLDHDESLHHWAVALANHDVETGECLDWDYAYEYHWGYLDAEYNYTYEYR